METVSDIETESVAVSDMVKGAEKDGEGVWDNVKDMEAVSVLEKGVPDGVTLMGREFVRDGTVPDIVELIVGIMEREPVRESGAETVGVIDGVTCPYTAAREQRTKKRTAKAFIFLN